MSSKHPPDRSVASAHRSEATAVGEEDGDGFGLDIGPRIRAFRLSSGMRLIDLSDKTDLSVSFISQLERGLTAASMRSLIKISNALGKTVHQLIAAQPQGPHRWSIVRRADSVVVHNDSGTARPIVERNPSFSALEFEGGPTQYFGYYRLDHDQLLYVVSGTFEIDLDGEVTRLYAGDSVYTQAGLPLRWRRIGRGGRLISMLTEPGISPRSDSPPV